MIKRFGRPADEHWRPESACHPLFQKLEKLFRTFIGWTEVAFEAVETVGVAAFDDADAFGAAQRRLEAHFAKLGVGVFAEGSERVGESVGGDAGDVGDLVLQVPDVRGEELGIGFF